MKSKAKLHITRREGPTKRSVAIAVSSVIWLGIGLANGALACSPTLSAFQNRPTLEKIISSKPIVFVGTVINSGRPGIGSATFKVEIPIRGTMDEAIEIRQGINSLCGNEFYSGERWFFAGDKNGSDYFGGSTLLVDQFSKPQRTGALGADHNEINKLIPRVATLPAPALVVRDFLSAKAPPSPVPGRELEPHSSAVVPPPRAATAGQVNNPEPSASRRRQQLKTLTIDRDLEQRLKICRGC